MNKNKRNLLECISIIICLLSSCVYDVGHIVGFKNCTNDTLFIGASHYNNIDSVNYQVFPMYLLDDSSLDSTEIILWRGENVSKEFVYPDSLVGIDAFDLFYNADTCYFFLIKYADAKKYSWDEIRAKKLFRKWIVTKNAEGKIDNEIKY